MTLNPPATPLAPEIPGSDVIDVDAVECDVVTLKSVEWSATQCKGYTLVLPDEKSPHTSYPFALYDMLILPWDYMVQNTMMTLRLMSQ